ncbi:MAG: hypothetical protein QOG10_6353 [Kribbellaceae bacterium]|nr:hypothetical protein [Kribbellaceae bacterium]
MEPRLADGAASHCWRVALAIRLGTGAAILATGAIALISTAMQDDHPISDPLTMIAIYAALWWFGAIRPAVWLSPDELVVRNPLRTHRIARDNVVSARSGSFGVVIIRRDGRPCTALALRKPIIAEEHAASLITYWAQTPPSSNQGEAPESSYAETPESPARRRVVDLLAAAGLAIALTIPALLLAWPHNPQWLWPVAGLIMVIAIVPFGITRQARDAPRRDH